MHTNLLAVNGTLIARVPENWCFDDDMYSQAKFSDSSANQSQQAQPHGHDPHEGSIEMVQLQPWDMKLNKTPRSAAFALNFGSRGTVCSIGKGRFYNEPAGVATDNLYSVPTTKHVML